MTERRRFPLGLTIATLVALAILVGLGTWQLKRLAWKEDMLAKIAALTDAPARPIGEVLARAARGEDVEFTRVTVDCAGIAAAPYQQIYAVVEGQIGSRLVSACRLAGTPYDAVLVDRGYIADTVSARPPVRADAAPLTVVGVLRKGDKKAGKLGAPIAAIGEGEGASAAKIWYGRDLAQIARALGAARPAPYFLMAETKTNPEQAALQPIGLPADIPNRHLEYALTWFGLAATLACVYAALLWRKMKGR